MPNVILNGTVKGDILAHDRVELGATARVTGNVYYGLIEMEMGAEINGKLIHEPRKAAARQASRTPGVDTAAADNVVNARFDASALALVDLIPTVCIPTISRHGYRSMNTVSAIAHASSSPMPPRPRSAS